MDQFVPPGCVTSKPQQQQQQNKEEQQQQQTPNATCITTTTTTPTTNNNSASKDADADTTTAECNATSISNKKKKGRRRGKKNKKDKRAEGEDVVEEEEEINVAAAEVVAGLLSNPPMENVEDEIVILSTNLNNAGLSSDESFEVSKPCSKKAGNRKSKKPAIVVPPDMLSECSDVTDDESCCSDSLDVDTALEDRAFFNAQRAAARKARQYAGHAASSAGVTIVEVTEEQAQAINKEEAAIKKERAENEEKDEKQDIKLENETDKELLSGSVSKSANVKKRTSTVESLFGDKLKDKTASNKNGKKNKKNRTSQENHATSEDVTDEAANISQPSKQSVAGDTPDSNASKPALGEVKVEAPNVSLFSCIGDDDSKTPVSATCAAPPRFMVSPYNQQVNFSHSMGRAENNWLHHPMLNNFSNNPVSGVGRFTSPQQHGNYRPRQQNQNNRPQRQDRQQQQFENNQRTEPNVAQVMRLANWDRFIQKVAYVVHIFERRNTRLGAGTLKPFADMNRNFALFSPNDSRIPRMKIPMSQCPPDLLGRKEEYSRRIYLAKMILWNDPKFALGELVRDIGRQGDINAESEAFLLQIGIDYSDFPEEVMADLPSVPVQGWTIPPEAMEGRKDLRSQCIFSIDPATARDLDDALSCELLPGGRYSVGVHIADVSHFVALDTELDKMAATRATSVYLVNRVIPMLPRLLCEQLCSLNPDEDRLAFSVIWEMDRSGQVQSTWFGRTIIRSCAKLSYEHAQSIIENPGKIDWAPEEMPPVSRFPISQVCQVITMLQSLAVQMRARRHNNGALRLDQNKLGFSLDPETKLPNAVHISEHRQSNHLIEEFMLLANISVAHKIYESFPQLAVLRCHPEPQVGQLQDIVNLLRTLNIEIDSTCAGSIYASLMEVAGEGRLSEARLEVIVNMLSKPMQNALYFCSGTYREDFAHYALNVPFYTHFTSPIRRYPDIMVHRLLAAAIDSDRYPVPGLSHDEIDRRCSISNEKKMSAKRASEYSNELYLAEFVRQVREIRTDGIIIGVLDRALDVLLLDYCTIKRTYLERLPLEELNYDNKNKNEPPAVHVVWSPDHANQLPSTAQSFTYFTLVKVVLTPFTNDQLKFNVTLVRPDS